MSVVIIDKDNFENEIINSEKTVLLDFWANRCAYCRMISPVIDEIAKEHPEVKVAKINVDECPEIAQDFKIKSIPSLFVLKNGEITNRLTGAKSKTRIEQMLK